MRIEVIAIVAVIFQQRPLKKQMAGGNNFMVMLCQISTEIFRNIFFKFLGIFGEIFH